MYSPAMVAWMGGDGFSIDDEPAVGWVPLGPGEVFVPAFLASARYFARVNRSNTVVSNTTVTNSYTNNTTVTGADFGHIVHASDPRLMQLALKVRF